MPSTRVGPASGKWAMSSCPASGSSSSSQSSSDSWQPSQEANFQTASDLRAVTAPPSPSGARRWSWRTTGPSLQTNSGPSWQCPQWPVAHFMLRSSESQMSEPATPRSRSAVAAKRIITSGPHAIATVFAGANVGAADQPGDDTHVPVPVLVGHVDDQLDVQRSAATRRARRGRAGRRASGRRTAAPRARSDRAGRSARGRRDAAARARARPRRPPRRGPRPPPAASRARTGRGRPRRRPAARRTRLRVTAPTARTVCTSAVLASGIALTEIGTSPEPST